MTEVVPIGSRFVDLPTGFALKRGGRLFGARIAYETWGRPNPSGDNVILILTGLSPSAHAAANDADASPGWWERMVGPGRPVDTDRWHVICINSLGSCYGSTGPASTDRRTGAAYGITFPELSIEDIADAAVFVVRALGFHRLACIIGCSMGGMTALSMLSRHPGIARNHINISSAVHALPFSIAVRSLQREAIRLDPRWRHGFYDPASLPVCGMSIARKLGIITYRSALEWDGRFGRVRLDTDPEGEDEQFGPEFEVEAYLERNARRFVGSFDPNCYLYLSRSMDWFDLGETENLTPKDALARISLDRALVIGVKSDILFPLQQQAQIAEGLVSGGVETELAALESPQGHDAFLVDIDRFGPVVGRFLSPQVNTDVKDAPGAAPFETIVAGSVAQRGLDQTRGERERL